MKKEEEVEEEEEEVEEDRDLITEFLFLVFILFLLPLCICAVICVFVSSCSDYHVYGVVRSLCIDYCVLCGHLGDFAVIVQCFSTICNSCRVYTV